MPVEAAGAGIAAMAIFGFTGSLHCAAMCGALAASACGPGQGRDQTSASRWLSPLQYYGARLGAYTVLGFASGLVTAMAVNRWILVVSPYLGIAFGALTAAYAVQELLRTLRPRPAARPGKLSAFAGRLNYWVLRLPLPRALALGLATALLPCGFLLAALLQAALLANPLHSALGMLAFGLASSPALLASVGLLRTIRLRFPRAAPLFAAALLLLSSLVILWRALTPPHDHSQHLHEMHP